MSQYCADWTLEMRVRSCYNVCRLQSVTFFIQSVAGMSQNWMRLLAKTSSQILAVVDHRRGKTPTQKLVA